MLLGVLAIALIVAGCGSSDTKAQQSPKGTAAGATATPVVEAVAFGTKVDIASSDGTAAYTVDHLQPVPPDAQIVKAKGTMYAVDVTIVAKSGKPKYNAYYIVARGTDGTKITPAVGDVKPGITSGQLDQGKQIAGHIAFDVPKGQTIKSIQFRDPKGKVLAIWGAA